MPPRLFFHCYETPLGCCGMAWNERAVIVGSQLPEENAGATRDRMRARFPAARELPLPDELPAPIRHAIAGVRALLAGEPRDLLELELDDSALPEFNREVLALTRRIPVGQTLSYGEVAARLGQPGAARAVGQAEGHNPFAPIVPCHRVLPTPGSGSKGGFSSHGGLATKQRLLLIEARATGQLGGEQGSLFGG
ncbi:methylated-DNA--[protein]-cysteine S-methyltransferase [Roseateles sp. DAIF2]|uniref:methylated-DNA--[protein]-cysteine S-methyltransferase n=1 Tax=Roseateles sp. DAIF2 TaxID=2714952 RepID=UPI0018A2C445|nr:methylated-DNA--[protein]-cysteine S-methyltransferase [Roseateles sp. DAIF2]QPF74353.1 methylated-DNA--[protein]-cysteine S-methyltransferase [Roseateles sp. DAIF2]